MPRPKKRTATGQAAQPVQVPAGGAYGTRQTREDMQRAAPINAGGSVNPTPAGPPSQASPMDAAAAHPPPQGVPLSAPTTRPGEPLTAGLPFGPGEATNPYSMFNENHLLMAAQALNDLGDQADSDTAALRATLNAFVANSGAV